MITNAAQQVCTVCGAENTEHATVCVSCRSFLQNRVPTLDLFSTAWGILEHPVRTSGIIARAEHKNYAFFLFALGGILPAMTIFHYFRAGLFFPSLLTVLPLGMLLGLVMGTLTAPLCAGVLAVGSGMTGGDGSFRSGLGAGAYALVPMILLGIITLPIQWLTFGEYQYSLNPHPSTINAASYWILNALQWIGVLWTCVLLVQGTRISMRVGWMKALLPAGAAVAIMGGAWILVFELLRSLMEQSEIYYAY